MSTVALSGNDTIMLNNRILADLADGDCVKLTFPNDIANLKTGKNGNTVYAFNASGKQCELEMRIVRSSADDKFLNNLIEQQDNNFAGTVLAIGEFVKKIGDGKGSITNDTYVLSGGIMQKRIEAKNNVEGDVEQSVAVYKMKFSNAPRAIT